MSDFTRAGHLFQQWFHSPAALVIAVVAALALLAGAAARWRREDLPYVPAATLLSPAERAFYHVLREAVADEYELFAKVRLGDILQVKSGVAGKRRLAAFGRISSKHADFVLCDPRTFGIVGVVELDDRSHQLPARRERDRFFDAALAVASVPIVRVPVQRRYSPEALRERLGAAFGSRTR